MDHKHTSQTQVWTWIPVRAQVGGCVRSIFMTTPVSKARSWEARGSFAARQLVDLGCP